MPWLIKNEDPRKSLFLVHVPRSGGTSLGQHFSVEERALETSNWYRTLGLKVFFYRYRVFETANFPVASRENVIGVIIIRLVSILCVRSAAINDDGGGGEVGPRILVGYVLITLVFIRMIIGTFIVTVASCNRIRPLRRVLWTVLRYVIPGMTVSVEWCTGVNETGYIMHLTAYKLLAHGYITPEIMEKSYSMSLVRNPYSRMVSLYLYNRFGPYESFDHFIRQWHDDVMYYYRKQRLCDDHYTPSHALPQVEMTHYKGKQLVQCIIKSEEVKYLSSNSVDEKEFLEQHPDLRELPPVVREAFNGLPHVNARKYSKKWWDYYNQDTLNTVYALYETDFYVFGYSATIEQRPDLKSPVDLVSSEASDDKFYGSVKGMVRNTALQSETARKARSCLIKECYLEKVKSVKVSGLSNAGRNGTLSKMD